MPENIDVETDDYILRTECGVVAIVWKNPASISNLQDIERVIIPWFKEDQNPHAIFMVSIRLKGAISDPGFSRQAGRQAKELVPFVKGVAVVQPEVSMTDRLLNITVRVVAALAGGMVPLKIHSDVSAASEWLKTIIPTLDDAQLTLGVKRMLRRS